MKKGLIFDLDGVITDTAKFHYIAWKELADAIGISIDLEFNEQLKGISRTDSLERILVHGGKEHQYSVEEKEKMATDKNTNYVKLLDDLSPADVLPGVKVFLERAKELNVPCALASASKNAPFILEKLELLDYFDTIVDPATLKNGKPDPEIFIKAAQQINIHPSQAVGFEDAKAGVKGIKDANMYAVGVETTEPLEEADMIINSFAQISVDEIIALD